MLCSNAQVSFELHNTFAVPLRVLDAHPLEVTEQGWGQFDIVVTVSGKGLGQGSLKWSTSQPLCLLFVDTVWSKRGRGQALTVTAKLGIRVDCGFMRMLPRFWGAIQTSVPASNEM